MFLMISPNMLKTYELCPRKFFLRYVKNISMPVNDDIFEFGKHIHALASYYLRGENIDKQHVEHIDQRYAGNRRFTDRGDHHCVGQTDRDGEHLLDNERQNQLFECSIWK